MYTQITSARLTVNIGIGSLQGFVKLISGVIESLLDFLTGGGFDYDIHERDEAGRTLLMWLENQTYESYCLILSHGAEADARSYDGSTVLHHFFYNSNARQQEAEPLQSPKNFPLGAGILALLIRAGADPQGVDKYGRSPSDIAGSQASGPLESVIPGLNLAIWHQALRMRKLDATQYCTCALHRLREAVEEPSYSGIFECPGNCRTWICPKHWGTWNAKRQRGRTDPFLEEIIAALHKWDVKSAREGFYSQRAVNVVIDWDIYDYWVGVLAYGIDARLEEHKILLALRVIDKIVTQQEQQLRLPKLHYIVEQKDAKIEETESRL